MGKISRTFELSLALIIVVSCLTLLMIKPANAQEILQGSPASDEWSPYIDFKMADGTVVEDNFSQQANQPLSLNLTAGANRSPEGRLYGVLEVSYVASWLNTPVVLYSWNGNLANFNDWFTNNSNINPNPNTHLIWAYYSQTPDGTNIYSTQGPPNWVDINLVLNDIPLGRQQINFTVVKAALYGYGPFSYAKIESSNTIGFTVTNKSSPTPAIPELSWFAIIPLLLFVFLAAAIVRHRKTANLKK